MRTVSHRSAALSVLMSLVAYVPALVFRRGMLLIDGTGADVLRPTPDVSSVALRWLISADLGTLNGGTREEGTLAGPFMWAAARLGLPEWIAQRLLIGSVILAAGIGTMWLLKGMRWDGSIERWMAAAAYMLSPYMTSLVSGQFHVLFAWAGMPWLIGAAIRSLEQRSWRMPAAFGIAMYLVAGASPTAIVYAVLAPLLYIVHSTVVTRDADWKSALAALARLTAVVAAVSAVWLVPLLSRFDTAVEADRIEHPRIEATSSLPAVDALRGVGEWRSAATESLAVGMPSALGTALRTEPLWMALSVATPAFALFAISTLRFRGRLFFAALITVGMMLSVGSLPISNPEPYGRVLGRLSRGALGALLSPTPRAVPLVALGCAACIGAGVERWFQLGRLTRPAIGYSAIGAVAIMAVPWCTGAALDGPALAAAPAAVEPQPDPSLRIFEFPPAVGRQSSNWAVTSLAHRVGDASVVNAAELAGAPDATQRLLRTVYRAIEEDRLRPHAVQPLFQLLNVDAIAVAKPSPGDVATATGFAALLTRSPGITKGTAPSGTDASWFSVNGTGRSLRVVDQRRAVILTGDGDAVVDLANAGLLTGGELLIDDTTLPRSTARALTPAPIVITDTRRWRPAVTGIGNAADGATARFGVVDLSGPLTTDGRLPPVDRGVGELDFTIVEQRGVSAVRATRYGPFGGYQATARPARALDGDETTAWTLSPQRLATGERLEIELNSVSSADRVEIVPYHSPDGSRVTSVRVTFDDTITVDAALPVAGAGSVALPPAGARRIAIEIIGTSSGDGTGEGTVGIAEVVIGTTRVREVTRVPRGDRTAEYAAGRRHVIVMSRLAGVPADLTDDVEPFLDRVVTLPASFDMRVSGTARGTWTDAQIGRCLPLVSVDGREVRLRLQRSAMESGVYDVSECDDAPLTLRAGEHEIVAARTTAGSLEQLVFDSATDSTYRSLISPEVAALDDTVEEFARRTETAAASWTLSLSSIQHQMMLVSAQSFDRGWSAAISGDEIPGAMRVNGYAGAWLVGAQPGGAQEMVVRWRPQRVFNIAGLVSLAAAGLCLAVTLLSRRGAGGALNAVVLTPTNELQTMHSSVVVLLSLGAFGIAAGAFPGVMAGATALAIDRWPHARRSLPLAPPLLLVLATGIQISSRIIETPRSPVATASGGGLVQTLTWTAVAVAVTLAASNAGRRPISRRTATRRWSDGLADS